MCTDEPMNSRKASASGARAPAGGASVIAATAAAMVTVTVAASHTREAAVAGRAGRTSSAATAASGRRRTARGHHLQCYVNKKHGQRQQPKQYAQNLASTRPVRLSLAGRFVAGRGLECHATKLIRFPVYRQPIARHSE